jgi:hypothetical protein
MGQFLQKKAEMLGAQVVEAETSGPNKTYPFSFSFSVLFI